jgi:hypothetical protein
MKRKPIEEGSGAKAGTVDPAQTGKAEEVKPVTDKLPVTKMPDDKKALACVLGLNPIKADSDPLFNSVYNALKTNTTTPGLEGIIVIRTIKGKQIATIEQSGFEKLLEKLGDKKYSSDLDGTNFQMVLGNQGRSGEDNFTTLGRIKALYLGCKVEVTNQNALSQDSDIAQEMKRLLTADLKFIVVKNGEIAKSFLKGYEIGRNPQMDKYLKALMDAYGLEEINPDSNDPNTQGALLELSRFIAQKMLDTAVSIDRSENKVFGKKENKLFGFWSKGLLEKTDEIPIAKRLGTAALELFLDKKFPDLDAVEDPPSVGDVMSGIAEEIMSNPEAPALIAAKEGKPTSEIDADFIYNTFVDNVWNKMTEGQRKEIEGLLQANPKAREMFKKLMLEYVTSGDVGVKEQQALGEEITSLGQKISALDTNTQLDVPQREALREKLTKQKKELELKKEALDKLVALSKEDPAKAFYSRLTGKGQVKIPGEGYVISKEAISGQVRSDDLTSFFGKH